MRVARITYRRTVRAIRREYIALFPFGEQNAIEAGIASDMGMHEPARIAEARKRCILKRTLAMNGLPVDPHASTRLLVSFVRTLHRIAA
jgi:hypothetical protein